MYCKHHVPQLEHVTIAALTASSITIVEFSIKICKFKKLSTVITVYCILLNPYSSHNLICMPMHILYVHYVRCQSCLAKC